MLLLVEVLNANASSST